MSETRTATAARADPTYHTRRGSRSFDRTLRVAEALDPKADSFLDIGCNSGMVSRYLLQNEQVNDATGFDLTDEALHPDLLTHRNFSFFKSDVTQFQLHREYDAIFYGAVHHHVVRAYGLGVAFEVLHALGQHCRYQMFFETGSLREGPRWEWQRRLNSYFSSDEDHHLALLRILGPRVKAFHVIGRFWIHGVRRYLLSIELDKVARRGTGPDIVTDNPVPWTLYRSSRGYTRSVGSRQQTLSPYDGATVSDSGVFFKVIEDDGCPIYLTKRRPLLPHIDAQEYAIGMQVVSEFAVRPIGRMQDGALVFPFVQGVDSEAWLNSSPPRAARKHISTLLLKARQDFAGQTLWLPPGALASVDGRTVLDVVDLHSANILVDAATTVPSVHVIDFQAHSDHNAARNDMRIALLLLRMRTRICTGLVMLSWATVKRTYYLVQASFLPFEERVIQRKPSVASLLTTKIRGILERPLLKLFPSLRE